MPRKSWITTYANKRVAQHCALYLCRVIDESADGDLADNHMELGEVTIGGKVSPNWVCKAVDKAGVGVGKRRGRRPVCSKAMLEALRRQVEAEPHLTVAEHRARLAAGSRAVPSLTTVWRRLEDLRAAARKAAALFS
ncbi:MAG: helix-turn-helix domain-containing protein [Verrucomicrobia bacterium]|nr:helix-turn-helix domain-containing protein [Verrucomicrobiota bacterium]